MISRLGWRISIIVTVMLWISIACRTFGVTPSLTPVWIVSVLSLFALYCSSERRYTRPYRGYAIAIAVVLSMVVYWVGYHEDIHLPLLMIYVHVLVSLILLWMAHPAKYRSIALVPWLMIGFFALVPRNPSPLSPQSIVQSLPMIQLYWDRVTDDEQISLITDQGSESLRPGADVIYPHTDITIQYASSHPSKNYVLIQLNTLTTLALAPQSVINLHYDGNQRSGSLEGGIARLTTTSPHLSPQLTLPAGSLSLSGTGSFQPAPSPPQLENKHHNLLTQAANIANQIRPSSWTHTAVGAAILRAKFQILSYLDKRYEKDIQTLYQYQCLVYGQWCGYVDQTWHDFSLHMQTWDTDLQQTMASGSDQGLSIRKNIQNLFH